MGMFDSFKMKYTVSGTNIEEIQYTEKDIELLDKWLSSIVTRKNLPYVTDNLLNRFGNISGVLFATEKELKNIKNITKKIIKYILNTQKLIIHMMQDDFKSMETPLLTSSEQVKRYLSIQYANRKNETLSIIISNAQGIMLGHEVISEGDVMSAPYYPKDLIEIVLQYPTAVNVILVHNHPGGNTNFSSQDIEVTKMIGYVLSFISIELLDHFLVAKDQIRSLREIKPFVFKFNKYFAVKFAEEFANEIKIQT